MPEDEAAVMRSIAVLLALLAWPAVASAQSLEDAVTGGYSSVASRYQWGSTGGGWPAPVPPTIDCDLSTWTSGPLPCGGAVFTPAGSPTAGVPTYWRPGGGVAGLGVGFDGVDDVLASTHAAISFTSATGCHRYTGSADGAARVLMGSGTTDTLAWRIYKGTNNIVSAYVYGGASTAVASSPAATSGAQNVLCWSFSHNGTAGTLMVAADGAAVATHSLTMDAPVFPTKTSIGADAVSGAQRWVGTSSDNRVFYGWAATSADLSRLVNSQYAKQGSLGEPLTVTGPATSAVLAKADGSPFVATTPANTPSIVAGGVQVYPAYVQALPYSEAIGASWTLSNITPSAATGPNEAATATALAATADAVVAYAAKSFTATAARWTCHGWFRAGTVDTAVFGLLQSTFVAATPQILHGPGSISGTGAMTVSGLSATAWTHVATATNADLSAASASVYLYPKTSSGALIVAGDSVQATMWNCHAGTVPMPYARTGASPLSVAGTAISAAHGIANPNQFCIRTTATPSRWTSSGLFGFGADSSANSMRLLAASDSKIYLWLYDSAGVARGANFAPVWAPGSEHTLVACNASGTAILFADGAEVARGASGGTGLMSATPAVLYVGATGSAPNTPLAGTISAITTYNTAVPEDCR